jgi:hypothetical protein
MGGVQYDRRSYLGGLQEAPFTHHGNMMASYCVAVMGQQYDERAGA